MLEDSRLADDLLALQKGLCPMELIWLVNHDVICLYCVDIVCVRFWLLCDESTVKSGSMHRTVAFIALPIYMDVQFYVTITSLDFVCS